ncbi:MAG: hypothetical protein U5K77_02185 [Candidatus Saccharibacteria bacterium]|nr:hypothetical protein [Candidatus Saccharibacteria bacterium]
MIKRIIWVWLGVLVIGFFVIGLYIYRNSHISEPQQQSNTIRQESLDIQTFNPQPAGQNIQPQD